MEFPTKANPGTREEHIALFEADWKNVLPKNNTQKDAVLAEIVDGLRQRWDTEREYAGHIFNFPVKVYLPNNRVCKISESEFNDLKESLIPAADKTGYVAVSRGLYPSLKPLLGWLLPKGWFRPTQIGGEETDLSSSGAYIIDPRDCNKTYNAVKGVLYGQTGFKFIEENGCFGHTTWMTPRQADYMENILPVIIDLDNRAHPHPQTSRGGYSASGHGGSGCSAGTCACPGGGCSASCCSGR